MSEHTETDPTETETDEVTPTVETETDPAKELAKWKALARKNEEQAKKNSDAAARLKEFEDAQKTEQQRLTEQLEAEREAARRNAIEAARYRAVMKHGLSEDDLEWLGDDPESMENRAARLAERLAQTTPDRQVSRRPQEKLKPGASPSGDEPFDSADLAEKLLSEGRL
jgi:hypothetical protein